MRMAAPLNVLVLPDLRFALGQISSNCFYHSRIIFYSCKNRIALKAQQPSDLLRYMAMIHGKTLFRTATRPCCLWSSTKLAKPTLRLIHFLIISQAYPKFSLKMFFRIQSFNTMGVFYPPLFSSFTNYLGVFRTFFIKVFGVTRAAEAERSHRTIWMASGLFFHGSSLA